MLTAIKREGSAVEDSRIMLLLETFFGKFRLLLMRVPGGKTKSLETVAARVNYKAKI